MNKNDESSRSTKFEKRRKNTKRLTFMLIFAVILIIVLIIVMLFSGGSDKPEETKPVPNQVEEPTEENDENQNDDRIEKESDDSKQEETEEKKDPEDNENPKDTQKAEDNEDPEDTQKAEDKDSNLKKETEEDPESVKTESVKSSDPNVAEAFKGNWKPVETSQSGAHTTNYDEGSTDRKEMEQAITTATGLDSMTVWWLGRAGDNEVEATVANKKDQSEIYRVNLKWVDEKGWKPTKIEMLKKNDKK